MKALLQWVDQIRDLCKPEKVYWCTGTDNEYDELCDLLVIQGTFQRLNDKLRPNCYLARSGSLNYNIIKKTRSKGCSSC